MKTMLKVSIVLSALSTASAFPGLACAAHPGDLDHSRSGQVVRYRDLDTSKESDMRELYARITAAARNECRAVEPAHLGPTFRFMKKCVEGAVNNAVAKVDQALLGAIHDANRSRLAAAK